MRHTLRTGLLLTGLLLLAAPGGAEPVPVHIPRPAPGTVEPYAFFVELLQKAIPAEVTPSGSPPRSQDAAVSMLRRREVDCAWMTSSRNREKFLRPVRVPLVDNRAGARVLLAKKKQLKALGRVAGVEELKAFKAAVLLGSWDHKVFRANGLPTVPATSFEERLKRVRNGEADYLPVSPLELFSDTSDLSDASDLSDLPSLEISFPLPVYFFTRKDQGQLAENIERGLRRMQENGVLAALQEKHLPGRKADAVTVRLRNPFLPGAPRNDRAVSSPPGP